MAGDNRAQLERYIPMAEFISRCFGEDVEVVLHDISDLEHSAIAIWNNHVSGRALGAPFTTYGLQIIREKLYRDRDFTADRKTALEGGKVLRSATYFIKDAAGELIGTICVNVDVTRFAEMARLFQSLAFGAERDSPQPEPAPSPVKEAFPDSVEDLIEATVQEYVAPGGSVHDLSVERKIQLVGQLSEKGIFMFKGTVKKVAAALDVSEPTVYRYLGNIGNGH